MAVGGRGNPETRSGEMGLGSLNDRPAEGVNADARELVMTVEQALTRERPSQQVPALLKLALMKISEMIETVWAAAWVFRDDEDVWKIAASLGFSPEGAAVRFRPGSALPCQVGERGVPLLVNDLDKYEFHRSVPEHYRMRSALYAPINIGPRTVGVFAVYSDRRNCYTQQDLDLLSAIGGHLGMIVASAIMEDRTRQVAVLRERNRHARDLHDGVQQVLSSLRIYLLEAQDVVREGDADDAIQILEDCTTVIDEASEDLQKSIARLRQQHETRDDLYADDVYAVGARMQRRLKAAGVATEMSFDPLELRPKISDALAWICREATANVLKHSHARNASLELQKIADAVVLRVSDDGVGLARGSESAQEDMHIGFQVMRERAEELDGVLEITPSHGGGVCIECRLPLGDDTAPK